MTAQDPPLADLLIRGAMIYDGTGGPPVAGDVSVQDGRIAHVGEGLAPRAREVIEAGGLALAPGFIDVHTHDDMAAFSSDGITPKISQGVTTVVVGNCGISAAPSPLLRRDTPVPPLDLLGGREAFTFDGFGDYLAALRGAALQVNVVPLVGHTTLRARAMDDLDRPATTAEIDHMLRELDQALAAGAAGVSTGLAYPPARFSTTDELVALVSRVAQAGALWTTHMRDERGGVVSAVAETIDIARRTGARTLISHHKCCGESGRGLSHATLQMIGAAREELSIDLDVYPYTASSTVLIETFARDSREVTISWSEPHPEMVGRGLAGIASEWGVDEGTAIERLKPGGAIYHQIDEADVERILRYPPSLVGSDGLPGDVNPHPRLWGAFPRVLGHYAREKGLFPLETAIAKMTGQTAAVLGLEAHGRIAPGMVADLVLFDPGRILDASTYEAPRNPAEGIVGVFLGGRAVWSDGAATGAGSGRVLGRHAADPGSDARA